MNRPPIQPPREHPEVQSLSATALSTAAFLGGAMLVLLTIAHPFVGIGFASGLLARRLTGSLVAGGRLVARRLDGSLTDGPEPTEPTPVTGGE